MYVEEEENFHDRMSLARNIDVTLMFILRFIRQKKF